MSRLDRKSEAQANAEALVRRTSTYADQHAASYVVRFGKPSHEMTTQELAAQLLAEFADEVPTAIHEGPDHIDAGGVPAMRPAFMAYIDSRDNAVVEPTPKTDSQGRALDPIIVGTYRKPLQAAVGGMLRGNGKHAWWGAIARRILIGGEAPIVAAMAEGAHRYQAMDAARDALVECRRRLTPNRMDLAPRERIV